MSPVHNGQNNLGPHETTQGDAQTLHHPILNGKSFIHAFWFYFSTESCHAIHSETFCLLVLFLHLMPWLGKMEQHTMTGIPSTITPNLRLLISYIGKTRCLGHKFDVLFDLWAANGNNGTEPPFASHDDLYKPLTPYS